MTTSFDSPPLETYAMFCDWCDEEVACIGFSTSTVECEACQYSIESLFYDW